MSRSIDLKGYRDIPNYSESYLDAIVDNLKDGRDHLIVEFHAKNPHHFDVSLAIGRRILRLVLPRADGDSEGIGCGKVGRLRVRYMCRQESMQQWALNP